MPLKLTQAKSMSPGKFELELTQMDAGIVKDVPTGTKLMISGTSMTQAQIDSKLKGYLATIQAADAAKQQYLASVTARRSITAEARDFYLQLKKVITAYFGSQSPQLDDFGLKPAKAKAASTATNAVAVAKRNATRAARGTKGKKQKAKINPNVNTPSSVMVGSDGSVTLGPPTPAVPSTPSTPAPGGSSTPASSAATPNASGAPATPAGNAPANG